MSFKYKAGDLLVATPTTENKSFHSKYIEYILIIKIYNMSDNPYYESFIFSKQQTFQQSKNLLENNKFWTFKAI